MVRLVRGLVSAAGKIEALPTGYTQMIPVVRPRCPGCASVEALAHISLGVLRRNPNVGPVEEHKGVGDLLWMEQGGTVELLGDCPRQGIDIPGLCDI